jgi:hypothetical protein
LPGPATQDITVVSGKEYQVSIGAGSAGGATAVCSDAFTGTLTGDASNMQAFDTAKTASSTTLTVTITGAVTDLQVEDVTGQADQNPSNNVSAGVATGPEQVADAWTEAAPDYSEVEDSGTKIIWTRGVGTGDAFVALALADIGLTIVGGETYILSYNVTENDGVDGNNLFCSSTSSLAPSSVISTDLGVQTYALVASSNSNLMRWTALSSFEGKTLVLENISMRRAEHGVNVDGVAYFNYANGNTVSGNVVTEAKGQTLRSDSLGSERDLSDWTLVRSTLGGSVTALDGTTLTNNGLIPNSGEGLTYQYLPVETALINGLPYVYEAILHAGNSTWAVVAVTDSNSDSITQYFELSGAGGVGVHSGGGTVEIDLMSDGWYRCRILFTDGVGSDPATGYVYAVDGDNNTTTIGSDGVKVWHYTDGATIKLGWYDWRALYESFATTNYSDGANDLSGGAETVDLTIPGTGDYTLSVSSDAAVTVAALGATGTGFGQATTGSPVTFNLSVAGTVTLTLNSGTLDKWDGLSQKQVEKASVASSWVPTSGATATRSADAGNKAFAYSNWSQTEGSWIADVWLSVIGGATRNTILTTHNGNTGQLYENGNFLYSRDGSSSSNDPTNLSGSEDEQIRCALDFGTGDTMEVGKRNITTTGSFTWDLTPANYDGEYDTNNIINIAYTAAGPIGIRDLYGYTTRLGKDYIEENF